MLQSLLALVSLGLVNYDYVLRSKLCLYKYNEKILAISEYFNRADVGMQDCKLEPNTLNVIYEYPASSMRLLP